MLSLVSNESHNIIPSLSRNMNSSKTYDIVVFHKNCPDGIAGLRCASKYYIENEIDLTILSISAGENPSGDFYNKQFFLNE